MTHARLTKLSTLPGGVLDPHGAADGSGPLTDGYTVLGHYEDPPVVGERFLMTRYERNGVLALGIMTTSEVTEILPTDPRYPVGTIDFRTLNSIYELTPLPNPTHSAPHAYEDQAQPQA